MNRVELLLEEQKRLQEENRKNGQKWTKLKQDYDKLRDKLSTLADSCTHQVMVPMGKKAFLPGQLVHTNEILVLLGENWFVERSAKQAGEIVTRRIAKCDDMIDKLVQERELLQNWVKETSKTVGEDGDCIEIVETDDEQVEKKPRKAHEPKQMNISSIQPDRGDTDDDEAYWRRLDELELEEELEKYEETLEEEETDEDVDDDGGGGEEEVEMRSKLKKKVSFGDIQEDRSKCQAGNVIRIRHNAQKPGQNSSQFHTLDHLNPGQLEEQFCSVEKTGNKSILKPFDASDLNVMNDADSSVDKARTVRQFVPTDAISETVIEREVRSEDQNTQSLEEKPRKVSKFKSSRMSS